MYILVHCLIRKIPLVILVYMYLNIISKQMRNKNTYSKQLLTAVGCSVVINISFMLGYL